MTDHTHGEWNQTFKTGPSWVPFGPGTASCGDITDSCEVRGERSHSDQRWPTNHRPQSSSSRHTTPDSKMSWLGLWEFTANRQPLTHCPGRRILPHHPSLQWEGTKKYIFLGQEEESSVTELCRSLSVCLSTATYTVPSFFLFSLSLPSHSLSLFLWPQCSCLERHYKSSTALLFITAVLLSLSLVVPALVGHVCPSRESSSG